jgi:hypothetical protein
VALVSLHLTIYRVRHIVVADCESYRGRVCGAHQRHHVHSKVREDEAMFVVLQ